MYVITNMDTEGKHYLMTILFIIFNSIDDSVYARRYQMLMQRHVKCAILIPLEHQASRGYGWWLGGSQRSVTSDKMKEE